MKTSSLASRRTALAAVLVLSITVVSAGCAADGSSGTVTPTATTPSGPTATPSRIPLATAKPQTGGRASLAAYLPSLITCIKAQGIPVTSKSTGKQVRQAFRALPLASQERVFTACGHVLPVSARQAIAKDLAAEKGGAK
jgi:hypothetical protein